MKKQEIKFCYCGQRIGSLYHDEHCLLYKKLKWHLKRAVFEKILIWIIALIIMFLMIYFSG
jgi:hypothetical protein